MPLVPSAPLLQLEETDAIFVGVKDAAALLDLSTNQMYALLNQGSIESRYFGRRRLVVLESLRDFAESLPSTPAAS